MRKCLIKPFGFIGDTLLTTGAARKLKEEHQFDVVDFANGFPQAAPLLEQNPWIDNVITTREPTSTPLHNLKLSGWDAMFQLTQTTFLIPPPLQFQQECGVQHPDTTFEIYTIPEYDEEVARQVSGPFIAVMEPDSWQQKAFGFTPEEYDKAVNIPYLGYGGRLRNINNILTELNKEFQLIQVGLNIQSMAAAKAPTGKYHGLAWDASVIKAADYFIGAEGGLANVAAGVGTKTALTSEFVWQLYGPKGVIRPIPEPKLGPRYYFPDAGHIDLNPYYTDDEVLTEYRNILSGKKTAKDYTYGWITTV